MWFKGSQTKATKMLSHRCFMKGAFHMVGPLFSVITVLHSTSCVHPPAFYPLRLETVYSDSIRKAELEARLSYLKVSPAPLPVGNDRVAPPSPRTHMLHAGPLPTCLCSSTCRVSSFYQKAAGCCRHSQARASAHYPGITAAVPHQCF